MQPSLMQPFQDKNEKILINKPSHLYYNCTGQLISIDGSLYTPCNRNILCTKNKYKLKQLPLDIKTAPA